MTLKELSFYEQAALLVPGTVALFGLLILFPELRPLFIENGITVGGLGLFLVIAYALGHLIAAGGNLLEALVWWPCGGMPSSWVVASGRFQLLSADQQAALLRKVNSRHQLELETLQGISKAEWRGHFHQLYCDVRQSGSTARLETMLGNYGLNRGLAAALLALLVTAIIRLPPDTIWYLAALVLALVGYTARTVRFGVYWAREVYIAFLLLPDPAATPIVSPHPHRPQVATSA